MNKGGRPLKFKNVKILQTKIDEYFMVTPKDEWTITGLAVFLDTSRETLINYQEKEEFFDTIKKAKDKVEMGYEIDLKKKGNTGTIFALKNFGWTDKSEIDNNNINIDVSDSLNETQKSLIAQRYGNK